MLGVKGFVSLNHAYLVNKQSGIGISSKYLVCLGPAIEASGCGSAQVSIELSKVLTCLITNNQILWIKKKNCDLGSF